MSGKGQGGKGKGIGMGRVLREDDESCLQDPAWLEKRKADRRAFDAWLIQNPKASQRYRGEGNAKQFHFILPEGFSLHPTKQKYFHCSLDLEAPVGEYFARGDVPIAQFTSYSDSFPRFSLNALHAFLPHVKEDQMERKKELGADGTDRHWEDDWVYADLDQSYQDLLVQVQHGDLVRVEGVGNMGYRWCGMHVAYGPKNDIALIRIGGEYGNSALPPEFLDAPEGYCSGEYSPPIEHFPPVKYLRPDCASSDQRDEIANAWKEADASFPRTQDDVKRHNEKCDSDYEQSYAYRQPPLAFGEDDGVLLWSEENSCRHMYFPPDNIPFTFKDTTLREMRMTVTETYLPPEEYFGQGVLPAEEVQAAKLEAGIMEQPTSVKGKEASSPKEEVKEEKPKKTGTKKAFASKKAPAKVAAKPSTKKLAPAKKKASAKTAKKAAKKAPGKKKVAPAKKKASAKTAKKAVKKVPAKKKVAPAKKKAPAKTAKKAVKKVPAKKKALTRK